MPAFTNMDRRNSIATEQPPASHTRGDERQPLQPQRPASSRGARPTQESPTLARSPSAPAGLQRTAIERGLTAPPIAGLTRPRAQWQQAYDPQPLHLFEGGPQAVSTAAEGLRRRRVERLVDAHVYKEALGNAMTDERLAILREHIIDQLMVVPRSEGSALCDVALLFGGPEASLMAQSNVLLTLLQHRNAAGFSSNSLPFGLESHVTSAVQRERNLLKKSCPRDVFFTMLAHYERPHLRAFGIGPLIKDLIIARIDPPPQYWDRWGSSDSVDLSALATRATSASYSYASALLNGVAPPNASPWVLANLAVGVLLMHNHGPQPHMHVEALSVATLREWVARIAPHVPPDDAVVCLRLLFAAAPEHRDAIWNQSRALQEYLPHALMADIVQELVHVWPEEMSDFAADVRAFVPPWVPKQQVSPWLKYVGDSMQGLGAQTKQLFARWCAPQKSLAERKDLLSTLVLWQERLPGALTAQRLPEAVAFITSRDVPQALIADLLYQLLLPPEQHPNLRSALDLILSSDLSPHRKSQAVNLLGQQDDTLRNASALALRHASAPAPRPENLESSMQQGRLRVSDSIIVQVMDRVPRTSRWHQTLQQVAAYVQAAKVDPTTDPLLLDSTRTGVSELDNALYTLTGPRLSGDATDALSADPPYALTASQRVVGLGYLAASLWQLLRDHPKDGSATPLAQQERQRARVDFILALARSVEVSKSRVCGWGLSERLSEACAGYIAGIEQPQIVYPAPLVRQFALELTRSDERLTRPGQEAFYHRALAHAEEVLHSPDAIEAFGALMLEMMQLDYDWPK